MKYTQHLQEAGLTKDQSHLYEVLLSEGPLIASTLARIAKTNRTLTYKLLDELEEVGLITRDDDQGASTVFVAQHPNALQKLIDAQLLRANNAKTALSGVLSNIISDYNKVSGQPGVRILEGEQGMSEALEETLESTDTIYTYADLTMIKKYVADINTKHMTERIKRKINKKVLVPDTQENRALLKNLDSPYTEARLVSPHDAPTFSTTMEIYNNKISYLTFNKGLIATIIEDAQVYAMHRYLFESAWEHGEVV